MNDSVCRSASFNSGPYLAVIRLFGPRGVAREIAVRRVLSETYSADRLVISEVTSGRVENNIIKVGYLLYKSVNAVRVGDSVLHNGKV